MDVNKWIRGIITGGRRTAIPIMTHPGIEITGKKVIDAVTDGQTHYEAIAALNKSYPHAEACTVIMDLTVEAEAFGAELVMNEDEVPSVTGRIVSDMASVEALKVPPLETGRVGQYLRANELAARNIDKPVFGGCIGPFSLAGRLFDMTEIMMAIYTEPETIQLLLDKCTDFIRSYCAAIKGTGVAGVVIAEPAAGLLSNEDCLAYSSVYVKEIVEAVQDDTFAVILHNCGNTGHCTPAMLHTGAAAYHFGNKADMAEVLGQCPADVLVMGNIDPVSVMKSSTPEQVIRSVRELLERTCAFPNFVLSTGCDTPPGVPFGNIEAFYDSLT